jgi:hypothetical protein
MAYHFEIIVRVLKMYDYYKNNNLPVNMVTKIFPISKKTSYIWLSKYNLKKY